MIPRLGIFAALFTTLSLALPIAAQATAGSRLTVNINGLKDRQGQVCLRIFASNTGFPLEGEQAVRQQCVALTAGAVQVNFTALRPGKYAIVALHDTNNNRELDRNLLGIPREGFGFSRNPVIRLGPPNFGETAIDVSGAAMTVDLQMRYMQ